MSMPLGQIELAQEFDARMSSEGGRVEVGMSRSRNKGTGTHINAYVGSSEKCMMHLHRNQRMPRALI